MHDFMYKDVLESVAALQCGIQQADVFLVPIQKGCERLKG